MQIHVTTLLSGANFRYYQCLATICHWHERMRPVQFTDPWVLLQAVGAKQSGLLIAGREQVPTLSLPVKESQRIRHMAAYEGTTGDLYLLTDDDILPFPQVEKYGDPWYDYVRDVFRRHPSLAMAQPFLFNENSHPYGLPELIPRRAVGGCRVIRRDAVSEMVDRLGDFPPMIPTKRGAYDAAITEGFGGKWMSAELSRWWGLHCGRNHSTLAARGYHPLTENPN